MLDKEGRKSRRKSKHEEKLIKKRKHTAKLSESTKPVFGVPLEVAYERDPSHDGVPLPAFFRYCIDYIEQYGLSTEGLYRLPGVNSQVQTLLSAINHGEPFPQITPTSAAYYQQHTPHSIDHGHFRSSNFGQVDGSGKSKQSQAATTTVSLRFQTATDKNASTISGTLPVINLPHDIAVVTSVVKHFLRNLPEPVLTQAIRGIMESIPSDSTQIYYSLAQLVHRDLPRSHRFLLSWLLQHLIHIVDRAGENLMTLSNISVVLSPCLGISHRLLAILLRPALPDVRIDLSVLDPSLTPVSQTQLGIYPDRWHWLFPHPDYVLRPYVPPLRLTPAMELPENDKELDAEMRKQQSLLSHLHNLIGQGEATAEIEALFWETQHLVTEIKRRKNLSDPEVIRAELNRRQTQLDRLHKMMLMEVDPSGGVTSSAQSICGSDSGGHRRRVPSLDKGFRSKPTPPPSSFTDELWSLQRHVTMLKRRLKQIEKQQTQPSSSKSNDVIPPGAHVVMSGSIPLIIPSVSELDEEEVLNLTLRKLPLDVSSAVSDLAAVPVQMPLPDVRMERPPSTSLAAADLDMDRRPSDENPKTIQLVRLPIQQDIPKGSSSAFTGTQSSAMSATVMQPTEKSSTPSELTIPNANRVNESTTSSVAESACPRTGNTTSVCEPADPALSQQSPTHFTEVTGMESKGCSLNYHERKSLHQVALYTARKQELEAIQTDLKSRIRSEQAEIRRLQSRISDLLKNGDQHLKRVYNEQIDALHLALAGPVDVPSSPDVINKPWTHLVEKLNKIGEDQSHLKDTVELNSSSEDTDEDDITHESDDSQPVTYVRLAEDGDDWLSTNIGDEGFDAQTGDDDEDADDTCEAELARTLYQLILDNARLEQLNCRYLEGIHAERNRCAELKVLLKLRNCGTPSSPFISNSPVPTTAL